MKSWLTALIEKVKRNLIKPVNRKLTNPCHLPTMRADLMTSQNWSSASRFLLYTSAACLMCLTVWTLYPGTSSEGEMVTLALSADEVIKAVYKHAYQKSDGTVDLVFNVPKGGQALLRLNNFDSSRTPDLDKEDTTTLAPQNNRTVKTLYPISLDTDYVINAVNVCTEGEQIDYIILVHSATAYSARRRTIRETFGSRGLFGNITQRVVFLLGTTTDPLVTKSIREEAFLHRDLVQGQFLDSYHNLTHKGVLGYRWVAEHCPRARIVIKVDDDVFLNPFKLVQQILPGYYNKTRTIACHLRPGGTSPIIRGKGKWQVQDDEFRGQQTFPFDYCNGYFVIITRDMIRPMLTAARLNPFFWIDDVYLFGILPATVGGVKFVNIREILSLSFTAGQKCFEEQGTACKLVAVSQWRPENPEKNWYTVLANLTETTKRELNVFGLSGTS